MDLARNASPDGNPSFQGRLLIVGGGGHGASIANAAALAGATLSGVLDDEDEPALSRADGGFGTPRLGGMTGLSPTAWNEPGGYGESVDAWALGVGEVPLRRRLITRAGELSSKAANVIHPSAIVAPSVKLGRGVFIGPGAIVQPRAVLSDFALINSGAIVEHDAEVGENSHIAPGATLAGYVRIGRDSLVGLNATLMPGRSVGDGCVVAAGSVVRLPVETGTRVAGVPAKPIQSH